MSSNLFLDETNSEIKDIITNGPCLSLKLPKLWIWQLQIEAFEPIAIFIATPNDFIGTYVYHHVHIDSDELKEINMIHEVAILFDLGGNRCVQNESRDVCISDYIEKVNKH